CARPLADVEAQRPGVDGDKRSGRLRTRRAGPPHPPVRRRPLQLVHPALTQAVLESQSDRDKAAAYQTLYEALRTVSGLMAPFAPFVSDAMYRNLSDGESVHLSDFPVAMAADDPQVEADMARARQAVEAGLAARDA